MATDLKVSVRRQIDRLRKEVAVATGQVAAYSMFTSRIEPLNDPQFMIAKSNKYIN